MTKEEKYVQYILMFHTPNKIFFFIPLPLDTCRLKSESEMVTQETKYLAGKMRSRETFELLNSNCWHYDILKKDT